MRRLAFILLIIPQVVWGGCLSQRVDLNCTPCSREMALEQLQNQISCSLSFNASRMRLEENVTISLQNVNLKEALEHVAGTQYRFEERGRHLMLIEREESNEPKKSKQTYLIEGIVRDALTGEVVRSATVYTVGNKYSALTDQDGFYQLNLQTSREFVGLSYSKQHYLDTIIIVRPEEEPIRQDIRLAPRSIPLTKMPTVSPEVPQRIKTVEELPMVKILVPERQSRLALNTAFLETIPIQVSLIPSVGTNRFTSGMKENVFSLNVLAGYNAGLNGFEVGSFVNIVRKDVKGIQAGGLGNIVGGKVQGFQAAGIFNNVRGSVMGFQAGGVYNIVLDTIRGLQAAGVFNVLNGTITGGQLAGLFNVATENMEGLQAAGLFNITKGNVKFGQAAGLCNFGGEVTGAQVAGILNVAKDSVMGTQISGFANFAKKDVEGVQLAGFANMTETDVRGTQIAGFVNVAQDVSGSQLAGFMNVGHDAKSQISGWMNIGHKVEGIQVGFLNFSDSTSGSFGFLSFSLKGMNHLDLAIDEVHPMNISYRTGSHLFYNILHVGFGSYYPTPLWSYGYGIGTHLGNPKNRATIHVELLARQLFVPKKTPASMNMNLKFEPSVAIRIGKKRPAVVLGPSINLVLQTDQLVGDDLSDGGSNPFVSAFPPIFKESSSVVDGFFWVGARAAFRI